jgi:hypothetical protein
MGGRLTGAGRVSPRHQRRARYGSAGGGDLRLTALTGQALSYDAEGNLLSDGMRDYAWDAENRLVGRRRVAMTSTPAGGGSAAPLCPARLYQHQQRAGEWHASTRRSWNI